MNQKPNIVFITGTDTGVGKTVLTGMLLHELRQQGVHALALKPFCSGDTSDVQILRTLQDNELKIKEVNPYYFPDPVAPIASRRPLQFTRREVLKHIRTVAVRCELLLVEGCGGVMVPLAPRFTILDLVAELNCSVIVVAANKLGVMNHTLLTVAALQSRGVANDSISVVLMEQKQHDASASSNEGILKKWLRPIPLFAVPYLGGNAGDPEVLKENAATTEALAKKIPDWR